MTKTKKKTSAQDATEQKPSISEPEEAPQEAPGAPVVPEAAAPIQIPPKVLKQAEALGVDLKQVVDWAQSVEQKLAVAEENFNRIGQFLEKMEPLVKLSEQIQQRQASQPVNQPASQPGGPDLGALAQFLPLITGGGADEEMLAMQKQMMQLSIDSMRQGMDFTNAIKNAIVSKITSKAVGEVVP